MIVYVSEKASFRKDAMSGRIEDKIQERMGRRVADNEVRAWQQSLTYMNVVLEDDGIPNDAGICIELGIPQTSKRIDFIVSGYDSRGSSNAVIIELKQWESAQLTGMDGIVRTYLGGGMREVNHPSYQAWSYAALLNDFNEAVYSGGIQLHPCAYLHNYKVYYQGRPGGYPLPCGKRSHSAVQDACGLPCLDAHRQSRVRDD
jgi:hypothetical protein